MRYFFTPKHLSHTAKLYSTRLSPVTPIIAQSFFNPLSAINPSTSPHFYSIRFSKTSKMSDDEPDLELLELLRKSLGLGPKDASAPPETKVLQHAEFIYNNSIDVALDMRSTKKAAIVVWEAMQQRSYSTKTWSEHELHPKSKDESTVNFIFTMDLLNFSFWSEKSQEERFTVDYKGKKWTGYWSLVAALQRALDEGRLNSHLSAHLKFCYINFTNLTRNPNHHAFILGQRRRMHRRRSPQRLSLCNR
jgi:hypothetical protein